MARHLPLLVLASLLGCAGNAAAGIYYSGEKFAELPAEWRGLLADLRLLRSVALPVTATSPASSLKQQYQQALTEIEKLAAERPLTAAEAADRGALLLRLGRVDAAVGQLRQDLARHPRQFELTANLAAAWQLAGDLQRAAELQRRAVQLAPPPQREVEALHLAWLERRLREPPGQQPLDDLFGLARKQAPPPRALAMLQQLLLWFPSEGRLLWPLAELANLYGDKAGAAELLEVAVGEFGLADAQLRKRRQELRLAWLEEMKKPLAGASELKTLHAAHGQPAIAFKSKRPLVQQRFDFKSLPAVRKQGVNVLPWGLLLETSLDGQYRPSFPAPLKELDGLQVELVGYMQPIGDELETGLFLLVEMPVGCWYCELPTVTGIVCVELKPDRTVQLCRTPLKITGRLKLNGTDPEDFFFTLTDAEAGVVD